MSTTDVHRSTASPQTALLTRVDAQGRAQPKGTPAQQQRAWVDFWDAVELQRALVESRSQWETRFCHSLTGALTAGERLGLPGAAEAVVWVTGDATLLRIACVDWTHRRAVVDTVAPYYDALQQMAAASDSGVPPEEEVIISLAELITYLALAAASNEQ